MNVEYKLGDKVQYRKNDILYEGMIKSIQGEKIESIGLIFVIVSKKEEIKHEL